MSITTTNDDSGLNVPAGSQTVPGPLTIDGNLTVTGNETVNGGLTVNGSIAGFVVIAPAPSGGDDSTMLQSLINTYFPLGVSVRLRAGIYLLNSELLFSGVPGIFGGAPGNYGQGAGTTLRANTLGMRSVIALVDYGFGNFSNLEIDGARKANYAMYCQNCSSNKFGQSGQVHWYNAVLDGIHFASTGLNQNNQFFFPLIDSNGTVYVTAGLSAQYTTGSYKTVIIGTATTIAGNATIAIVGGSDMTTRGIRPGSLIRIGSSRFTAFYGEVASVTANTVVVNPIFGSKGLPAITASGQDFAIGVGDGVHEEPASTNGYSNFIGGAIRTNGNAGVFISALYGDSFLTTLIDFANMANVQIGAQNASTSSALFVNCYMEGSAGVHYWLAAVTNIHITVPSGDDPFFWVVEQDGNTGTLTRGGLSESIDIGRKQNFALLVRNNAGTLEAKTLGDWLAGTAPPNYVDRISNMPGGTWTAIASVNAGAGFGTAGIGILSTATQVLLFNNPNEQNIFNHLDGECVVEGNTTGTNYRCTPSINTTNVNGVTRARMSLRLIDGSNGAGGINEVLWNAAAIPAGTQIIIRVNVAMR